LSGDINPYRYTRNNPINFVDPLGLAPRDKLFGYPKAFWQWYHRKKRPGDPDLDKAKAQAAEFYEEWKSLGQPGTDKKMGRGRCETRGSQRSAKGPKGLKVLGVFQFLQIIFDAYDAQRRAEESGKDVWQQMLEDMYPEIIGEDFGT
jgi:uncharacterized protein RhaS with RHS repeats